MLGKIFNRINIRDAKMQAVDHTEPCYTPTHPSDYSGMQVYHRLESTKPYKPPRFLELETKWQIPLPYDWIFTIINLYFLDDKFALLNLTKTCRSLAQVCGPLCYQSIVVTSRRDLKGVSDAEQFAALLSRSPHILDYIQHLKIQDDLQMFQGSRPITAEEESLCYIFTRKYHKLRRLHLSLHVVWSILPIQLQHAFSVAFALPNLHEVVFEHVNISTSLLTYLSNISDLEVRAGEVLSRSITLEIPSKICTPTRLLFMDHSRTGFITRNLFAETSPLRLSQLEHLQIYARGMNLKLLCEPLQACSTLTILEFHVSTWGKSKSFSFVYLFCAQFLLHCSTRPRQSTWPSHAYFPHFICGHLYGNPGIDGPQRFSWLVNTLATCLQPSRIEPSRS